MPCSAHTLPDFLCCPQLCHPSPPRASGTRATALLSEATVSIHCPLAATSPRPTLSLSPFPQGTCTKAQPILRILCSPESFSPALTLARPTLGSVQRVPTSFQRSYSYIFPILFWHSYCSPRINFDVWHTNIKYCLFYHEFFLRDLLHGIS